MDLKSHSDLGESKKEKATTVVWWLFVFKSNVVRKAGENFLQQK